MIDDTATNCSHQWIAVISAALIACIAATWLHDTPLLGVLALAGLVANADTCRDYIEISPSMATALNPLIGYDKAAEIAKEAFSANRGVREVALERCLGAKFASTKAE